jgi:hypothetical protein
VVRGVTTWLRFGFVELSFLEGCFKRRRRFVNPVEANDLKKEDLATLGFVYSTLSLSLSVFVIVP